MFILMWFSFTFALNLFRLGFLGVSQTGGEETTRGYNSGTVKDIAVIFWQHTHDWKLVYWSSQNNGFGVMSRHNDVISM